MGVLGYKLFEPLVAPTTKPKHENQPSEEPLLYLRRKSKKSGVIVEARQSNLAFCATLRITFDDIRMKTSLFNGLRVGFMPIIGGCSVVRRSCFA